MIAVLTTATSAGSSNEKRKRKKKAREKGRRERIVVELSKFLPSGGEGTHQFEIAVLR
jgi:hypothetical protein